MFKKFFSKFLHSCAPTTDTLLGDFRAKVNDLKALADLHEKLADLHDDVVQEHEKLADEAYAESVKAREAAERLESVLLGAAEC